MAAESSLDRLTVEDRRRVRAASSRRWRTLGDKSSDRRTPARRLLERQTTGSGD